MSVIGGQFGMVNGRASLSNWSVEQTTEPARYRAANIRNGTQRVEGIKDFTGSFTQHLALPTVLPGETFQFQGYTGPTSGAYNTNGRVYDSGAAGAIVDSVAITWSFNAGDPSITSVINFSNASSNGLTSSLTTALVDNSTGILPSICDLLIETGPSGTETVWTNWTQAVLTITANNPATVNASTNCWRIRKAGPIDWTLAVTEDDDEQKLTIGNDYRIKLFTTAALYWELKWGHLESYTGLTVDLEGGIVSKTANFGMVGHDGTTPGLITKPGGGAYWPPT